MKNIKIAIAEDHAILRETITEMLESEDGLKVVFDTPNGQELIDKLVEEEIDVIILDINMPIMNGGEALTIIKERYPNTKVIILSMFHTQDHIESYLEMGANGFLSKGCDFRILVKAIKESHQTGHYLDDVVTPELLRAIATKKNYKI